MEELRLWSRGQILMATLLFALVTALGGEPGGSSFGRSFLIGLALSALPALIFWAYARRLGAEATSWTAWFKMAVPLLLAVGLSHPIGDFVAGGVREFTKEELRNSLPVLAALDAALILASRWAFNRATWGDPRLRIGLANFFSVLLLLPLAYLAYVVREI